MKEVSGYNPSKDPRLINCKTECGNERCFGKRYGLFAEKTCPNFKEPKPLTNADRIRAMADEEMAEWLDKLIEHCNDGPCFNCFMQKACLTSMLDWLKQEAEE